MPSTQRGADTRFVRDTMLLAAGTAAAQLAVLAAMPVWSRLYAPDDFARYGVFTAVAGVVSIALTLRYDTCIVVARDDAQARALLRLCAGLVVGLGVPLALVALLLPATWRERAGVAPLEDWLAVAVAAGALAALVAAVQYGVNRSGGFARMSASRATLGVVLAGAGVALGGLGQHDGLLVAHLASGAAALVVLLPGLRPVASRAGSTGWPEAVAAARAHAAAPRHLWPAALLDVFTQQLPVLLIVAWYTQSLAGQFSLAWRVVAVPAFVLAGAAGSVFFQRMSTLAERPAEARRLLLSTWRLFAAVGALPALALIGWGEPLFAWAFGDTWRPAGGIAAVLAPMLWAMLISSTTSSSLIVLGLQRWSLPFGLAMLVYRPLAFWLGTRAGRLDIGLWAWVGAEIAAIALYNLLVWRTLARRAGER